MGQRSGTSFEEVRDECCSLYSVTPLLKNKLILIEMEEALLTQEACHVCCTMMEDGGWKPGVLISWNEPLSPSDIVNHSKNGLVCKPFRLSHCITFPSIEKWQNLIGFR